MSTVAFLNIAMHGRVNPTLPVVAELVRRGHSVSYHTSPAFRAEIAATGAAVHLYPGGDQPLPDPPLPITLLAGLARTTVAVLPDVLTDLRGVRPDLIVHDAACLWGAVAAHELGHDGQRRVDASVHGDIEERDGAHRPTPDTAEAG